MKNKDKNTPTIETERLLLRKFNENDMEALFAIYKDPEVNTYLPWFPVETLEETKVIFQEKYEEIYIKPEGYRYAICLKADNVPIGYINVSDDENHDFGYALRKEFWHQGIVSEAGVSIIEQLKKNDFKYISATHDIKNPNSGKVMKKIGLYYKYTYSVALWKPKNISATFRLYQLTFNEWEEEKYRKCWDKCPGHFVEEDV